MNKEKESCDCVVNKVLSSMGKKECDATLGAIDDIVGLGLIDIKTKITAKMDVAVGDILHDDGDVKRGDMLQYIAGEMLLETLKRVVETEVSSRKS